MVSIYFDLYPLNFIPKEINVNAFEICINLIEKYLTDYTCSENHCNWTKQHLRFQYKASKFNLELIRQNLNKTKTKQKI